ncbi:TolC family protein [Chlamydiota bacterium]
MKSIFRALAFPYVVMLALCGCSRVPPADDNCVTSFIDARIQKQAHWERHTCKATKEAICYLLGQELTVDSAVQIALLNNPEVQVIFDEIGIAHADLIEAGLFRNPIFDGYVRFPDKALALNTQFSIAQNFLDIFLVPLRKKVAAAELEQTKLRVADAILNLSFDVQETFYRYVATKEKLILLEVLVDATDVANRLAILQKKQGNINDLELQVRMNDYLQAKIDYTNNTAELIALREEMNRLLGLSTNACWCMTQNLPDIPKNDLPSDCLEAIALSKRLDIGAAKWEMERFFRMWRTKRWWAYADGTLGASTEQEAEGFQETGPTFFLPIPFFNYGQADRARIYALYDQSLNRLKALEIAVLSEVRSARDRLSIHRQLILDYQQQLLPLQESILSTSQRFYNYMALSVYKLIGSKKQEVEMQIKYRKALLDYWMTRVDLDRSLGGNLYWATFEVGLLCETEGASNELL